MRKIVIIIFILGILVYSQDKPKLWVNKQITDHDNDFYIVEDLETGTRCYAVTNHTLNASGYAISCVKK